jgi:hypothetical protein
MTKTARQLEAPPLPAAPMTDTPKKRRDLAYVQQALRANARAEQGEQGDDGVDDEVPEPGEEDVETPPSVAQAAANGVQNPATGFGPPEWFKMPPGGLPADIEPGSAVGFMKFPVWVTGAPQKGERQCALRPLTPALERFARQATKGDKTGYETTANLAKMMICVVDGALPELFKAGHASVNHFWAEIGPKARQAIVTFYLQTHQFTQAERDRFLADCLAVRTVG